MIVRFWGTRGSVPTPGNPVPRLARAIERLAAWQTEVRISPAVARFFKAQAPFEKGQHRIWLADAVAALKNPKGRAWLLSDPGRSALLRNTVTPTVLGQPMLFNKSNIDNFDF